MDKNQIDEIRKKILSAVKLSGSDYSKALAELEQLKKQAVSDISATGPTLNLVLSLISEALGDVYMTQNNVTMADKAFAEMFFEANKAYTADNDRYRSHYGRCCRKRASFYSFTLGCIKPSYPPKQLNEAQKKVFDMAEALYKTAIGATFQPGQPMPIAVADLHAVCLHELMAMHAAVGNTDAAIKYGKDGVEVEKTIYAKLTDKTHALRTARRMGTLAAVYMAAQQAEPASLLLEQAIEISEKHKAEDPAAFELLLARHSLTLANCCSALPHKASLAEQYIKNGVKLMTAANEKSDSKLIDDVITAYLMAGDYFARIKKYAPAVDHYTWAYNMAQVMFDKTKNAKYQQIMDRVKKYVHQ